MNCYDAIDLMGDELAGGAPAHARAGFDEHLRECAACRTYLEQLRLTVRALKGLPRGGSTSRRRSELIARFRSTARRRG